MKILFISHTADGGHFKVGSHHLAREISKKGIEVVHLSTNHSKLHRIPGISKRHKRSNIQEIRTDAAGVVHIVPQTVLPIQLSSSKRRILSLLKRVGFEEPDFVLIDQPLFSGIVASLRKNSTIVYRPTDEYPSGLANACQRRLLPLVDGIIATSRPVYDAIASSGLVKVPGIVLENGVESEIFNIGEESQRKGFVYIGAMDHRFDWNAICTIAEADLNEEIHLYGPNPISIQNLPANVFVEGPLLYSDVPNILSRYRVGLLPLNDSVQNNGRSPMKYYEYLASGLYVLGSETSELRRRQKSGVFLYRNSDELASQLADLQIQNGTNIAGAAESKDFDWSGISNRLLKFLDGLRR